MSEKESHCTECGADYTANEECQCGFVAQEMDPARELDAVEVLISVAKEAMKAIEAVNEEDAGPMAMPPQIAQDLREAAYGLEDIWSALPVSVLIALRLEMHAAYFNAKAMRDDNIEDLSAYLEHVTGEEHGPPMTPRQEDGIEIDPMDDDGMVSAANPEMLQRLSALNKEDLAVRNMKFFMRNDVPVDIRERVGMTLTEVIETYNPDIQVRCPYVDECTHIDFGEYKTCPHSDWHRVTVACLNVCPLYEYPHKTTCKPMEESDEEAIV